MALLLARPVDIGDRVLIRSGAPAPMGNRPPDGTGSAAGQRYSRPPRRTAPAVRPLRVWPAPMICLLNVLAEGLGNAGSVVKRVSLLLAELLVQPAQHLPAANH